MQVANCENEMRTSLFFLLLVVEFGLAGARGFGAELNPVVAAWLAAQTNIQSWAADFIQTRAFKSLSQPLTATGHVWFAAPNRFHWEVKHPAPTIAVRAPTELMV